jgi:hypothetical protein
VNEIEALRTLVVRLLADVYDKLADLELRVARLETQTDNLPLGYSRLFIAEMMTQHFDLAELEMMSFDMNIDADEISGDTRDERVRSLIGYCERRLKTHELIFHCKRLRPGVQWPAIPHQR